jgi:hypothetical protein
MNEILLRSLDCEGIPAGTIRFTKEGSGRSEFCRWRRHLRGAAAPTFGRPTVAMDWGIAWPASRSAQRYDLAKFLTSQNGWMTPAEVIAWIAFRNPLPHAKWDEFTNDKLIRSWPEWGFKHGIVAMEDQARLLLAALQARSEGRVWRAPNVDLFGGGWAKPYRALVSRLMRQHAASATTLAADLEQDIKTHTTVYAALDRAQRDMIAAAREERLELFGHKAKGDGQSDPSAVAERVEAVLFLGPRTIDLDGWIREDRQLPIEEWAGYRGPYYDRLHFRTSKVLALWPAQAPPESDISNIPPAGTAAQETLLTKWLVSQMAAAPTMPRSKEAMKDAARSVGVKFSGRAFERAWHAAVQESGASAWSKPGARSKRRIDTPN